MNTWKNKEAWKEGSNLVSHVGMEYQMQNGFMKSLQLVNEQGYAVAVIDFLDDIVERTDYSPRHIIEGIEWINEMIDLHKKSFNKGA